MGIAAEVRVSANALLGLPGLLEDTLEPLAHRRWLASWYNSPSYRLPPRVQYCHQSEPGRLKLSSVNWRGPHSGCSQVARLAGRRSPSPPRT